MQVVWVREARDRAQLKLLALIAEGLGSKRTGRDWEDPADMIAEAFDEAEVTGARRSTDPQERRSEVMAFVRALGGEVN